MMSGKKVDRVSRLRLKNRPAAKAQISADPSAERRCVLVSIRYIVYVSFLILIKQEPCQLTEIAIIFNTL